MRKGFRILSIALSLILIFSVGIVNAAESPILQEIGVSNGDFENYGNYGWTAYSEFGDSSYALTVEDFDVYEGYCAAKLTKNDMGAFNITSDTSGILSGALHSFGAYIKTVNAEGCEMYAVLTQYLNNNKIITSVSEKLYGTLDSYTKITGSVFTDPEVSYITLAVVINDSGEYFGNEAVMLVDNVFINRHTPQLTTFSSNLGFEQSVYENGNYPADTAVKFSDGYGAPPIIKTEESIFYSGARSLYFEKEGNSSSAEIVTLTPAYAFEGKYRWGGYFNSGSKGKITPVLYVYDSYNELIRTVTSDSFTFSESGREWIRLCADVILPENTAFVSFGIMISEGEIKLYADELFCNMLGDVSKNGVLGAEDIIALKQMLLGINPESEFCDINSDSRVNIIDLIALKKYFSSIK